MQIHQSTLNKFTLLISLCAFVSCTGLKETKVDEVHFLIQAIESGTMGKIEQALKRRDLVNFEERPGPDGKFQFITPLLFAISKSRIEVVRVLLDAGANPNKGAPSKLWIYFQDPSAPRFPLGAAVETGDPDLVKLLLAKGASVDLRISRNAATPLFLALQQYLKASEARQASYLLIVRALLKQGANVNTQLHGYDGVLSKTPLDFVIQWKQHFRGGDDKPELLINLLRSFGALTESELEVKAATAK